MATTRHISDKVVGRLTLYRRALRELKAASQLTIFSHDLAKKVGVTPVQLRRDLMHIGYEGSPRRGYEVAKLLASVSALLDGDVKQRCVIVGVGNLGRALLAYFVARNPTVEIVAGFEADPAMTGRVLHGARIHPEAEMETIIKATGARVAVIAVPREAAQEVANRLIHAGITGILNFAPTPLLVPAMVYVEDVDLTRSLEVVSCFANLHDKE